MLMNDQAEERNDHIIVFCGWSGELSKAIGVEMRRWVEEIFEPFVFGWISTENIQGGTISFDAILRTLRSAEIGIFSLTNSNANNLWMHFELGSILGKNENPVVLPFLVEAHSRDFGPPLSGLQFLRCLSREQNQMAILAIHDKIVQLLYRRYCAEHGFKAKSFGAFSLSNCPVQRRQTMERIESTWKSHEQMLRDAIDRYHAALSTTPLYRSHETALKSIHGLKTIADEMSRQRREFEMEIISTRLREELRKSNRLLAGDFVLPVYPQATYMRRVMEPVMRSLEDGDTFTTLTIPEFWARDISAEEARAGDERWREAFFPENMHAVVDRNVTIDRVILVKQDLVQALQSRDFAEAAEHLEATAALERLVQNIELVMRKLYEKANGKPPERDADLYDEHEHFRNRFVICGAGEYEDVAHEPIPFVVIKRRDTVLLSITAAHLLDRNGLPQIRFDFANLRSTREKSVYEDMLDRQRRTREGTYAITNARMRTMSWRTFRDTVLKKGVIQIKENFLDDYEGFHQSVD